MKLVQMIAATAALTLSAPTLAATIIGGNTAVRVTADVAGLGLTLGTFGSATINTTIPGVPRVFFPITGGTLDPSTLAGSIQHTGSGVTFTAGSNSLLARDFVIDTIGQQLLGNVFLNGASVASNAPIFTFNLSGLSAAQITDLSNPAIALLISSTAASVFTSVFGAPDLTGVQFGLAATAPALAAAPPIPEPTSWAMLVSGFAVVGTLLRRRRRVMAIA